MTQHWTELRRDLADWLRGRRQVLIGCDFDGTLSPLVDHAHDARLPRTVLHILESLTALRGVRLAVISGRSLSDLRRRVGLENVWYAGNHGLEMLGRDGLESLAPQGAESVPIVREAVRRLTDALAEVPGAWVEDKRLTATVHYRLVDPLRQSVVHSIVQAVLKGHPHLLLRVGKCVCEIRPDIAWHKGAALDRFMEEWGVTEAATAFLGDDVTDFDAFGKLTHGWGIVVGEPPDHNARCRVNDPADVAALLAWIVGVRSAATRR